MDTLPQVSIYVITFRRSHLLIRALRSLVAQTEPAWVAWVVNDDPSDTQVMEVIKTINDRRIRLYEPGMQRGAAANFNIAYREKDTPFAALLEDDNWWEPEFLAHMISALESNPHCEMACGNERIWREMEGGLWENTGTTIWPANESTSEWITKAVDACGSAKLCNSSVLFRTANSSQWQTPDNIPVDVTEHFRERCVPQPLLLVHKPLVNYAETISTYRSSKGSLWGDYQCLLIGSCFSALKPDRRLRLAMALWQEIGCNPSPRATSLLMASCAFSEAACLWATSSIVQRIRFSAFVVRRMPSFLGTLNLRRRLAVQWGFLCNSRFNQNL